MASSFTWLDHSEQDKRKMLDVLTLFSEKTTRDELGVGAVRDAFADLFFPGTSTIQTRARYFLFIPWIYLDLVKRKTPSSQIAAKLRQKEVDLINALIASGETRGVIGIQARSGLKRLPSSVYWYGLGAWGIRRFPGSQGDYHRSLDDFYHRSNRSQRNDDGEPVSGKIMPDWDVGLPAAPTNFPQNATFRLSAAEAEYLADCIHLKHADSLLAFLVGCGHAPVSADFPWEHPLFDEFPAPIQKQLNHARNFSEAIHGAALLYNLMLAEQRQANELIDRYQGSLEVWKENLAIRYPDLSQWNRQEFWNTLVARGAQISPITKQFIEGWLNLVSNPPALQTIATCLEARRYIQERESFLKRGQARLTNPRALELWQGDSGTVRLDYRWGAAQTLLADILDGLTQEKSDVAA